MKKKNLCHQKQTLKFKLEEEVSLKEVLEPPKTARGDPAFVPFRRLM